MPITRVNPKNRHFRRNTFSNKPPHEKQVELTKEKVIVPERRPFWKKWFAFLKLLLKKELPNAV